MKIDAGPLGRFLDLLYPPNIYCICCGDLIDKSRLHGLCDVCNRTIPWLPDNPFRPTMASFAFDEVLAVARYGIQARNMVNGLKHRGQTYVARSLGMLLAQRVALEGQAYDWLVPVPLHAKRQRQRGFNQSELLARYAACDLSAELRTDILQKHRATDSMRKADGRLRRQLLADAFSIAPGKEDLVMGRRILLVDDVCTTGTTADHCARTLKKAGALQVSLLCFAISAGYYG